MHWSNMTNTNLKTYLRYVSRRLPNIPIQEYKDVKRNNIFLPSSFIFHSNPNAYPFKYNKVSNEGEEQFKKSVVVYQSLDFFPYYLFQ